MTGNQEWLDNLKIGDEVAVTNHGIGALHRHISFYKVSKITKTTISAGPYKYRKNGGLIIGHKWCYDRIEPATDLLKKESALANERQKLLSALDKVRIRSLDTDVLRKLAVLLGLT